MRLVPIFAPPRKLVAASKNGGCDRAGFGLFVPTSLNHMHMLRPPETSSQLCGRAIKRGAPWRFRGRPADRDCRGSKTNAHRCVVQRSALHAMARSHPPPSAAGDSADHARRRGPRYRIGAWRRSIRAFLPSTTHTPHHTTPHTTTTSPRRHAALLLYNLSLALCRALNLRCAPQDHLPRALALSLALPWFSLALHSLCTPSDCCTQSSDAASIAAAGWRLVAIRSRLPISPSSRCASHRRQAHKSTAVEHLEHSELTLFLSMDPPALAAVCV